MFKCLKHFENHFYRSPRFPDLLQSGSVAEMSEQACCEGIPFDWTCLGHRDFAGSTIFYYIAFVVLEYLNVWRFWATEFVFVKHVVETLNDIDDCFFSFCWFMMSSVQVLYRLDMLLQKVLRYMC